MLIINQNAEGRPEIFETVQGEGLQAGVAAVFIRLQGCDVHCFFCDEKDTWMRRESNSFEMSPKAILDYISEFNSPIKQIIITGGEPTQQDFKPLVIELMQHGYQIAIETAATGSFSDDLFYEYPQNLFITFSPKEPFSTTKIHSEAIWQRADEIKFVVANAAATDYVLNTIIPKNLNSKPVFLVADWFNLESSRELAWKLCREYPHALRMGFQSHKLVEMP